MTRLGSRLPAIALARGRARRIAFGDLTPLQWFRIIAIHTHHHLKVIQRHPAGGSSTD